MTDIVMEGGEDPGSAPRVDGSAEAVLPAPSAVTLLVSPQEGTTYEVLCVGWNSVGSPIVVGDDGGLRLLDMNEMVRDITWEHI